MAKQCKEEKCRFWDAEEGHCAVDINCNRNPIIQDYEDWFAPVEDEEE